MNGPKVYIKMISSCYCVQGFIHLDLLPCDDFVTLHRRFLHRGHRCSWNGNCSSVYLWTRCPLVFSFIQASIGRMLSSLGKSSRWVRNDSWDCITDCCILLLQARLLIFGTIMDCRRGSIQAGCWLILSFIQAAVGAILGGSVCKSLALVVRSCCTGLRRWGG